MSARDAPSHENCPGLRGRPIAWRFDDETYSVGFLGGGSSAECPTVKDEKLIKSCHWYQRSFQMFLGSFDPSLQISILKYKIIVQQTIKSNYTESCEVRWTSLMHTKIRTVDPAFEEGKNVKVAPASQTITAK